MAAAMSLPTVDRMNRNTSNTDTFVRSAGWLQRNRWLVVGLWVAVLIGLTVAAQLVGASYRNDLSLPGTESQQLADYLQRADPTDGAESVSIVAQDGAGLTGPATRNRVQTMLARVRELPDVVVVSDLYAEPGAMSDDGTVGYATVRFDLAGADLPPEAVRAVIATARAAAKGSLRVELGGDAIRSAEGSGGGPAEGLGILAALVILLLMFGSVLAACLPLITAVVAVGSTLGLIALVSHLTTVPDYVAPLMVLVGLGVGIDYALLIFARYRSELLRGADRDAAARTALDTAGRSVLFAGVTVMIALLGLLTLGLGSLQGIALAVALTVLVTMIASLTLLPALLSIFGNRIERSIRRRARRVRREPGQRWRRWAASVRRHAWSAMALGLLVLGAMALPALGMRLGIADAGTDAPDTTSRAAYDLLANGFGPGVNGPLVVLAQAEPGVVDDLVGVLRTTPGVSSVAPPQALPDGTASLVLVVPGSGPQDAATAELVDRLRTQVLPRFQGGNGGSYLVGGSTAAAADFAAAVSTRLPWFVLTVVGLSALLLMVVFRSLAVPIKAAALNILSIAASLGVVTLVFQHGLFGVQPGPVEAFVPVMIFAIVFGLSMDYEVFLVSRMHEEWRRSGDPVRAVREGLAATGGVITAAGAIMIVVFAAFLLSPDRMLQQFGLGLAVAVLVDALVIRCLVVPAVMGLLGRRAWWLPGWMDRLLPTVALEPGPGSGAPADPAQADSSNAKS